MLKMFNILDIGERAGSGIPNIFRVWREQGWDEPTTRNIWMPTTHNFPIPAPLSGAGNEAYLLYTCTRKEHLYDQ